MILMLAQVHLDGIQPMRAADLLTNLTAMDSEVRARLVILTNHPGDYRTALEGLDNRLQKKIEMTVTQPPDVIKRVKEVLAEE